MNKELKHLIEQLKGKTYPQSIHRDFYRYGEEAYDELEKLVSVQETEENQISNAILVMFDLCAKATPAKLPRFLEILQVCLLSSDKKIRSSSARALIGTLYLYMNTSDFYSIGPQSYDAAVSAVKLAHANERDMEIREHLDEFLTKI